MGILRKGHVHCTVDPQYRRSQDWRKKWPYWKTAVKGEGGGGTTVLTIETFIVQVWDLLGSTTVLSYNLFLEKLRKQMTPNFNKA